MKKFNKKGKVTLGTIALLIGISGFTLTGCSNNEMIESSIEELFNDSNNTKTEQAINDYIEEDYDGKTSLDKITMLEDYIKIAEELHEVEFEKLTGEKEVSVSNESLLSIDELNSKYDRMMEIKDKYDIDSNKMIMCDETIEYFNLLKEIRVQSLLVNNYINDNGYDTIVDFGLDEVKSTLYSVDDSYTNIKVGENPNPTANTEPSDYRITYRADDNEEDVYITNTSDLGYVINDIYTSQNSIKKISSGSYEYNEERVNALKDFINDIKCVSQNEYKVDKDYIKTK